MSRKIILVLSLLFCSVLSFSQIKTETEIMTFNDIDRSYVIFVPQNTTENKNYSVIFVLHGGGGTGKGLARTTRWRFNYLAKRDGFIVVYPNGLGKSWNDGRLDTLAYARKNNINDVGFIKAIINKLSGNYNINQNNIFACGISNGGFMSQRLAYELSDKIKGIGVVAANLSEIQSKQNIPTNPVSILFVNGTHDPLVPYLGGDVTVFNKKRGIVLSVPESIKTWKKLNNCTILTGKTKFSDINKKDSCVATKTEWQNPENPKLKVTAIKIQNGGHTWPGTKQYFPKKLIGNTNRDFNACDEIWAFFKTLM